MVTATALAALATPILLKIGRWLLHQISIWGWWRIRRYMRRKIRRFRRRAKKWAARGRVMLSDFNLGRIQRWTAAMEWMNENRRRLTRDAADAAERHLRSKIPYHVSCEECTAGAVR